MYFFYRTSNYRNWRPVGRKSRDFSPLLFTKDFLIDIYLFRHPLIIVWTKSKSRFSYPRTHYVTGRDASNPKGIGSNIYFTRILDGEDPAACCKGNDNSLEGLETSSCEGEIGQNRCNDVTAGRQFRPHLAEVHLAP
jgi:hypothetical protein